MESLKFGKGNSKLAKEIATFSLPAGETCPGADKCLAWVKRIRGKSVLFDGPRQCVRCYAASDEARYTQTFEARKYNLETLKGKSRDQMTGIILRSVPDKPMVRVHVSGDFYNEEYFRAWVSASLAKPDVIFYAYTKSLHIWLRAKNLGLVLPNNFRITASMGGKFDSLAPELTKRIAYIATPEEYNRLYKGLPIDTDDSHAYQEKEEPFVLMVHGNQPKQSKKG